MTRSRRARVLALLPALLVGAGCGIANGAAGVDHLMYEDQIAICRYCAEEGDVCAELDDGSWGCRPFGDLQACDAAKDLFEQHGPESPYLSPARGKTALDEGFRSDCEGGRNPFIAEVLVYDFERDTGLMTDWSSEENGPERGELVTLFDADQNPHRPYSWDAQQLFSSVGNDEVFLVEMVFCLSLVLEDDVALQVADENGHYSNPICLTAPE